MSDPTAPDDAADRAWFRSQVDPVLDAEPVPDAWASIAARTLGDVPAPVPARSTSARWLAIAAVLALLAGLAVVVAATRSDDTTSLTADEPDATGWYIPSSLPEGWKLRTAWVTKRPTSCGHNGRQWMGTPVNGVTPRLELTYTRCASELPAGGQPGPALGHGVDETVLESLDSKPASHQLSWIDDGGWSLFAAGGLTQDDLIAAAEAIVANPSSVAAPLPGLEMSGASFGNGPLPGPTVAVSLETPSGQIASYRLAVPGGGPPGTPFTEEAPVDVAGQPLPVEVRTPHYEDLPERAQAMGLCCRSASSYLGTWPGADLQVPRSNFSSDDAGEEPTTEAGWDAYDDSLLALIGTLRPATTAEWRAFLATAEDRPSERLFTADDLLDATGQPRTQADTTTTTAPQATTAPAGSDDGSRSYRGTYPGTPVPRDDEDERLTSLDDLEISLEIEDLHQQPSDPSLAIGEVVPAKLIVHNTSDRPVVLTECTLAFTRWGLVPEADPAAPLPEAADGGCSAFPEETVPAGGTIRLPMDWSRPAGFVAQRPAPDGSGRFLGSLPGGRYSATVEVPGRDSDVRLKIPVTVVDPLCPASDDDVEPYLGLPASQARALAKRNGKKLGMATLDGEAIAPPEGTDCDRVNVDIWLSAVVNAYVR